MFNVISCSEIVSDPSLSENSQSLANNSSTQLKADNVNNLNRSYPVFAGNNSCFICPIFWQPPWDRIILLINASRMLAGICSRVRSGSLFIFRFFLAREVQFDLVAKHVFRGVPTHTKHSFQFRGIITCASQTLHEMQIFMVLCLSSVPYYPAFSRHGPSLNSETATLKDFVGFRCQGQGQGSFSCLNAFWDVIHIHVATFLYFSE